MVANMLEIGSITKCMAREYLHGTTAVNMKASTLTIKRKALEYLPGRMEAATKVAGTMVSNTVRRITETQKVLSNIVPGTTVSEPVNLGELTRTRHRSSVKPRNRPRFG